MLYTGGVSFFAGCFLTFPIILAQLWMFVAPGLYRNEKQVFFPYLIVTPVLFFLGGALVYYILMPTAWGFFLKFQSSGAETGLPIQLEAKVDQYLSLVMQLIFAFGVCFEVPVVLSRLGRAGIVTAKGLRERRRYAIVIAFIVAAVITPPDVFSQIALAIPLCGLYELSILLVSRIEKSRHVRAA